MISRSDIRRTITILVCALSVLGAFAQPPDKQTKVVLFKEHTPTQWDTVNVMKNCVKMNPLLFLQGEIPVYFERAISPRVSLEVGLGITARNYISLQLGGEADDFGAGTEVQHKLAAHVAARYYLTDDLEPYGWYVSPEFATRTYTKLITTKDAQGEFTDDKLKDERVYNDMKLLIGYQVLSGTSNWLVDFYGGFGARNRDLQKVREEVDLVNDTRNYTVEQVDDTVLGIYLGFKVGIGF
jgi:hypothetical protein